MGRVDEALDAAARALAGDPSLGYFQRHRPRYASDLEALEVLYRGGELLELGALPCHLTFCLRQLGYPQLGVDLAPQRMGEFVAGHGLDVITCDIEHQRLPFVDDRFSLVLMHEIFEHLRIDLITTLCEVRRVMKPDGKLRITTPNLYSISNLISLARGRGLLDPYVEYSKLHGTGHMGHVREYAAFEVTRFLERIGFRIDEVRYDAYGPSWRGQVARAAQRIVPRLRPYLAIIATKV